MDTSERSKTVKPGDRVWIFDSNRRRYDDNKRVIYRAHFNPVVIEDETARSWVITYQGRRFNINKKTGEIGSTTYPGMSKVVYYSEQEIDQACWIHDNRAEITRKVSFCRDYKTLRKIEALLAGEGE